jgi:hypothetical protein
MRSKSSQHEPEADENVEVDILSIEDNRGDAEVNWSESALAVNDGSCVELKKYETYDLNIDQNQDDRANEIKLLSFKRPHMRAFHYAWWSYHVAFLMWFSISPLLSEVQESLGISKQQVWTSSITAVAGTIIMRFALGPVCDKYGPRIRKWTNARAI